MKARLIFTDNALPFILRAFGKATNDDGIIIDTATGDPILTPEEETLKKDKFGGIKKGSEIFIKKDLLSVIKLAENKY